MEDNEHYFGVYKMGSKGTVVPLNSREIQAAREELLQKLDIRIVIHKVGEKTVDPKPES